MLRSVIGSDYVPAVVVTDNNKYMIVLNIIYFLLLFCFYIIILLDMPGVNLCIGMVGSDEIEEDCGVVVF